MPPVSLYLVHVSTPLLPRAVTPQCGSFGSHSSVCVRDSEEGFCCACCASRGSIGSGGEGGPRREAGRGLQSWQLVYTRLLQRGRKGRERERGREGERERGRERGGEGGREGGRERMGGMGSGHVHSYVQTLWGPCIIHVSWGAGHVHVSWGPAMYYGGEGGGGGHVSWGGGLAMYMYHGASRVSWGGLLLAASLCLRHEAVLQLSRAVTRLAPIKHGA